MPNLNKIMLMGHLGKDPEIRSTNTGKKVANFSLATTEKYKGDSKTQWHKIIMWDTLAELAEKHLSKGDCIYIEGKVEYREFTDRDNNKRTSTEITAFVMQFIKTKKSEERNLTASNDEGGAAFGSSSDDDTPF